MHYLSLTHSFAHEIARENLSFHILLSITLSSKNIQSKFTLILVFKKTELILATVNYIRQYQLNFMPIEESKITFKYRADNSLYLDNKKNSFAALLSHIHFKYQISNALDY